MENAIGWLGTHEDTKKAEEIGRLYSQATGQPVYDPDETAWCSIFIGAMLGGEQFDLTGITPMVKSWLSFRSAKRVSLSEAQYGDIVILDRTTDPNFGHGGFYVGTSGKYIQILGGNQGDQVSVASFNKARLAGIVRPIPSGGAVVSGPLFEEKAPSIMRELIQALNISTEDAAAILGNLGHECDGFRAHQEYGHTGASGGIGWAQWTGSRRNDYEKWAAARGLNVRSDEANLGFLIHELTVTGEKRVLPEMQSAYGLYNKTKIFCDLFERPGIKAYDNRLRYAERAMKAFGTQPSLPVPEPPTVPTDGTISPDDLLGRVRPETVTVRDTITSQIEGFPRGTVETTYARKSVRFIPDQPGLASPSTIQSTRRNIMTNYSKLIGSIIGALVPFGAIFGLDLSWTQDPQVQAVLVAFGSWLGTYFAPANT